MASTPETPTSSRSPSAVPSPAAETANMKPVKAIRQRRRKITDRERKTIRDYHRANPHLSQLDVTKWFAENHNHIIPQSTVSRILSPLYSYLDVMSEHKIKDSARKRNTENPKLSEALFEWHMHQRLLQDQRSSDTDFNAKAREFWGEIDDYKGRPCPTLNNNWIYKWKERYGLGKQEDRETKPLITEAEDLETVQAAVEGYAADDVFVMDETLLHWKRLEPRPPPEAHLTVINCCNITGTEKLQTWIVGEHASPRSFGENRCYARGLDFQYVHNSSARVNSAIMRDWLGWFKKQMSQRQPQRPALLVIDKLIPHIGGVHLMRHHEGDTDVRVLIAPDNAGVMDPFEGSIIPAWKLQYRWIHYNFVLDERRQGRDGAAMTVLHAVRWIIQAWNDDLTTRYIARAFGSWVADAKMDTTNSAFPRSVEAKAAAMHNEVVEAVRALMRPNIQRMNTAELQQLIAPEDEHIQDPASEEDVFAAIAAQYHAPQDADEHADIPDRKIQTVQAALAILEPVQQLCEELDHDTRRLQSDVHKLTQWLKGQVKVNNK